MTTGAGTPTLDQLRVFVDIVDTGSFTAAARKTNRALSVISYAISNLEAQLGLMLFDRETTRKPQLTVAGRVILAEARSILGGISTLQSKVNGMLGGLEGELSVVLDSLLPAERMIDALTGFAAEFPSVVLHVHVETLGAVANLVLERTATIGISGPFTASYAELDRMSVGSLRMVPVAGPRHPLASVPSTGHRAKAGRDHVQLVVSDRSPLTLGRDFSVSSSVTWRVADLSAKHVLLKAGIGWGMMPFALVADDLATGALVELRLPDATAFDYLVDAIHRSDMPLGPAAAWLIDRFRHQAQAGPLTS